jgi:hypothetical protein
MHSVSEAAMLNVSPYCHCLLDSVSNVSANGRTLIFLCTVSFLAVLPDFSIYTDWLHFFIFLRTKLNVILGMENIHMKESYKGVIKNLR